MKENTIKSRNKIIRESYIFRYMENMTQLTNIVIYTEL